MCFNDSFGNCETKTGTVFFGRKEWFIKLINNFSRNTTAVILTLNQNFIVKLLARNCRRGAYLQSARASLAFVSMFKKTSSNLVRSPLNLFIFLSILEVISIFDFSKLRDMANRTAELRRTCPRGKEARFNWFQLLSSVRSSSKSHICLAPSMHSSQTQEPLAVSA